MNVTLFKKMFRDHWKSLLSWGLVIIFMVTVQLSVYPSIVKSGDAAKQFIDSYPEAFKKMFRMEDYTSGAGFLGTELFSLMLPLVMIGVGVIWSTSATAEEEETGTADLLFTLPISRHTILLSKMAATFTALILLATTTFLNVLLLEGYFGLTVSTVNLAYACLTHLFLGSFFSGIGFFLGALTGRKGLSLGISSGLAIICFLFFSLSPLVDDFKFTNSINPFQWTLAKNILSSGLDVPGLVKLVISSIVLYIAATVLLERRQIRS